MTKLINLPYNCKELINLYALNTVRDYENLIVFNKIIDYEPCNYSTPMLQKAINNYNKVIKKQMVKRNIFFNNCISAKYIFNQQIVDYIIFNNFKEGSEIAFVVSDDEKKYKLHIAFKKWLMTIRE